MLGMVAMGCASARQTRGGMAKPGKAETAGFAQRADRDRALPADEARGERAGLSADDYAPHTLIVWYDDSVGKQPLLDAAKAMHCEVIYDYRTFNGVALRLPDNLPIDEGISRLQKVEGVLQVNRDRVYHLDGGARTD